MKNLNKNKIWSLLGTFVVTFFATVNSWGQEIGAVSNYRVETSRVGENLVTKSCHDTYGPFCSRYGTPGPNNITTYNCWKTITDNDIVQIVKIDGKIGIGTNTPTEKLDVNGTIKATTVNATSFQLNGQPFTGSSQWTTNGSKIHYASGNVGIGNGNPTTKLEIGTNTPAGALSTITNDPVLLNVHGSATFDDNNDNALTQVSINTEYRLANSALTVGGPTFIGSWDETKAQATPQAIKTDYLSRYNLWVTKGVVSEDFAITPKGQWQDRVFYEGYDLPALKEVEVFIQQNKHLPGVPSEKDVKEKGYTIHQINNVFLEKIEQLVLYSIQQEKKLNEQATYTSKLEKTLQEQAKQLNKQTDYTSQLEKTLQEQAKQLEAFKLKLDAIQISLEKDKK